MSDFHEFPDTPDFPGTQEFFRPLQIVDLPQNIHFH